jgi:hypothetical protein
VLMRMALILSVAVDVTVGEKRALARTGFERRGQEGLMLTCVLVPPYTVRHRPGTIPELVLRRLAQRQWHVRGGWTGFVRERKSKLGLGRIRMVLDGARWVARGVVEWDGERLSIQSSVVVWHAHAQGKVVVGS